MNPLATQSAADLAAEIALGHQKVHKAVARKIQELHDCGLADFEIVARGYPLPLVRSVLRGAPPGVPK